MTDYFTHVSGSIPLDVVDFDPVQVLEAEAAELSHRAYLSRLSYRGHAPLVGEGSAGGVSFLSAGITSSRRGDEPEGAGL